MERPLHADIEHIDWIPKTSKPTIRRISARKHGLHIRPLEHPHNDAIPNWIILPGHVTPGLGDSHFEISRSGQLRLKIGGVIRFPRFLPHVMLQGGTSLPHRAFRLTKTNATRWGKLTHITDCSYTIGVSLSPASFATFLQGVTSLNMATTTHTDLRVILQSDQDVQSSTSSQHDLTDISIRQSSEALTSPGREPTNVASTVPEGGYGWTVVSICALLTFWFNGISGSWGIIQAALLQSQLTSTSTSTISFVGTLGLACIVAFGLFAVRFMRLFGIRTTALLGVALVSAGEITSSFTTSNVGGLFGTSGVLFGLGACLCYSVSNTLPTQYFSAKLGLASGLVKLGGGIGAAVLSIAINAMIQRVGVPWTFRVLGLCTLATGGPAAWFIRERVPIGRIPFLDLSMFRHLSFTAVFCAGAIGTFALFVPPFFLPLVAQSIGLSSSTGAALVAGFNCCTALGRFFSGWASDSIGPVNMFLSMMTLNAVSMLAIWPVSNSLGPLVAFAMLNGLANGAFFTVYPVVVANTGASIGDARSGPAVAMSMAITGWTGGYLMGVPIAGYLLQASGVGVGFPSIGGAGGNRNSQSDAEFGASIDPYRPAIFYAGGMALAAAGFVLIARLKMGHGGKKKV